MAKLDEADRAFIKQLAINEHRIGAYIFTLVPNLNDADEILQETHVRLWEGRDRYTPGTNFRAWAFRVAYFEVLSWRKRTRRRPLVFDDQLIERLSDSMIRPAAEGNDRHAALAECLEELSGRSRDILRRVYSVGERIKDIAADFESSADSMYKTVQRLRNALRRCIDQRLAEEGAK